MRWLFLMIGGVATAAMLLISMRLNFLFGYSLGQTPEKALVFGCVSVISDAWKGLGPIFILALYRAKRRWSVAGAAAIWIVCFSYSISSALGVAIEDRSSRTGSRETIRDELRRDRRRRKTPREEDAKDFARIALLRNSRPRSIRRFCVPWKALSAYAAPWVSSPTIASAPTRARPRAAPRFRTCARSLRPRTRNAISIDGCRS